MPASAQAATSGSPNCMVGPDRRDHDLGPARPWRPARPGRRCRPRSARGRRARGRASASLSRTASSLLRLRPASAQRSPEGACSARYSAVSAPVKPVAPSRTMSRSRCAGSREDDMCRLSHSRNQALDPAVRSADAADQGGRSRYFQINSEGPAMSLRPSVTRTVTRTLVSLAAVVGLGAAFVAGTSYGGSDHAGDRRRGGARDGRLTRGVLRLGPDPCRSPATTCWTGTSSAAWTWSVPTGGAATPTSSTTSRRARPAATPCAHRWPQAQAPAPVRSTNGETGTNVQEAGVDEPDVVKTDGKHAVPGPGRRPGHLRRERRRGRAARARSTCPGPRAPTAPRSCCPATPWSRCRSVAPTGAVAGRSPSW